jgi:hypothetical protein
MDIGLLHVQCCCYSWQIVMKTEFSRHIFEKYLNNKFYENPSSGSRVVVTCGRTDRHGATNSHSSKFCEHKKPPKSTQLCIDGSLRQCGRLAARKVYLFLQLIGREPTCYGQTDGDESIFLTVFL